MAPNFFYLLGFFSYVEFNNVALAVGQACICAQMVVERFCKIQARNFFRTDPVLDFGRVG